MPPMKSDTETSPNSVRLLRRRRFLRAAALTGGALALRPALSASGLGLAAPQAPPIFRIRQRAKRIIYINLVGGASHIDLFDPKPFLARHHGEPCPDELFKGKRFAFIKQQPTLMGSPWFFQPSGQSGIEISSLLPELRKIVDRITLIRSMTTDEFNHAPAQLLLQTGSGRSGRPSLASWIDFALESENPDLPHAAVIVRGNYPGAGNALWGNGFLPGTYQGTELRSSGSPVLFLSDPPGVSRASRRGVVNAVLALNRLQFETAGDPEIETRSRQYDLAYRMQESIPEATDLSLESPETLALYGADLETSNFGNDCLQARRLIERGMRFVELVNSGWDHHEQIAAELPKKCREIDRAAAALVLDLAARGLLSETLIVCATEFGRTPMAQTMGGTGLQYVVAGRDHQPHAFSIWVAGGGFKEGFAYGTTDEFGASVVSNPVHIHDLNATLLHCLGVDHEHLTYFFQGRNYRLTDVGGNVVEALLA